MLPGLWGRELAAEEGCRILSKATVTKTQPCAVRTQCSSVAREVILLLLQPPLLSWCAPSQHNYTTTAANGEQKVIWVLFFFFKCQ